jgi:putative flavoprotein involved in K+ transport
MAAEEHKEREMAEQVEVVIIGGGQAGLALSYYLTQQGRTHLVLEQGRVGETWRNGRWDSFTLVTPNWMTQLPGFPYQGDDPDGFMPREGIVAYLEQYAASFIAPLQFGVRVKAVRQQPGGDGYLVEANNMTFAAANVVLATGAYPKPKLPTASAALPVDIRQLHTSEYCNPQTLPSGAVLVWALDSRAARSPRNFTRADGRSTCLLQAAEEFRDATEARTSPGGSLE